jgi:hypothetical protein
MNVDMSAKYHKILKGNSFASNPIDIILAEVSGIDDCFSAEDLLGYKIIGETEERHEFDGGLTCDKLQLIIDMGPFAGRSLNFLSDCHRYN